ncbi:M4 family metallopeptidase [Marmoricola sp. RAF53]|uniref:M4 family metallopeptidase n=1 Tax=Marmoricola sp. RAF53 TaxID=3233059 RepID=UPI003F960F44
MRRPAALALVLVAPLLALVPGAVATADDDPAAAATRDLRADAEAGITLKRGEDGQVAFVGTPARGSVDNPEVAAGDSVAAAAREHLDRYGAALEPATGSTFARTGTVRTTSGVDLVRYQQAVDGVRVLGGQVVVALDDHRDLRSLTSAVSDTDVQAAAASVSAADAAATARAAVAGRGSSGAALTVTDLGRWLLDPAVVGLDLPGGVRTVRRFEVSDGASVRELVLVDDRTGVVVFKASMIADINRVVCDRLGLRGPETTCTTGIPGRTEGGASSPVAEVNNAYNFARETSDLYAAAAPPAYQDLTALLGVDVAGVKRLASTVRFCSDEAVGTPSVFVDDCPYPNAFWNGQQMFYGEGFAAADDVVAHEMTHGYTERTAGLFYWGQPGAINESMSDVIGEIVDHRNGSDDDSTWTIGEDLVDVGPNHVDYGPFRSMSDPAASPFHDPDSMTSSTYYPGPYDADGVHLNSGVGNKTAYLISQGTGGTSFNGQSFTGIDGTDAQLRKTAVLYLEAIPRLVAASDYADLASTLDQTCLDLVRAGTVRGATFTSADCVKVHQATLATALRSAPPTVVKPADASTACPVGTLKRVLYSSEDGTTASAMLRDPSPAGPVNDPDSVFAWYRDAAGYSFRNETWSVIDPPFSAANRLRVAAPVSLPAGQESFLSFRGWWVNDYVPPLLPGESADPLHPPGAHDGGTVEIVRAGDQVVPAAADWVNGPTELLNASPVSPDGALKAFTRSSHGWVGSRLDLTAFAGNQVQPQFTMRSDSIDGQIGWFLDDITVNTCDTVLRTPTGISVTGALNAVTVRWNGTGQQVSGFRLRVAGSARTWTVPASARSALLSGLVAPTSSVRVYLQAVNPGMSGSAETSKSINRGLITIVGRRVGSKVLLKGTVKAAGVTPVRGAAVRVERRSGARWILVKTVRTGAGGVWNATVVRRSKAVYRATYVGAPSLVGTSSTRSVRR